jgi:hypothetical protein
VFLSGEGGGGGGGGEGRGEVNNLVNSKWG